jgi:VCBS repeat-containing protein
MDNKKNCKRAGFGSAGKARHHRSLLQRALRLEMLERRELFAVQAFNDSFSLTSGSNATNSAIFLNVLGNDQGPSFTQAVSAANIDYTASNKTANTATYVIPNRPSSTIPQRSLIVGAIAIPGTGGYADIDLSRDTDALNNGNATLVRLRSNEGVVLGTSRENPIPNAAGNAAINQVVLNYMVGTTATTQTYLSSVAAPANDGELIAKPGVALFPYSQGWVGGSYNTDGAAIVGHPSLTVTNPATGTYEVAVSGVTDSFSDGYLFSITSGNSDNYARAVPIGGNLWRVVVRDNASTNAGRESGPFSLVYIPKGAQGLTGGLVRGDAVESTPMIQSSGGFSIVRTGPGNWTMTVDGQSPTTGVLVLESGDTDRTAGLNTYLTYEPAANGIDFLIRQMQFEGTATNLVDDDFLVQFIPFENRIAPTSGLTLVSYGSPVSPTGQASENGIALVASPDGTIRYQYDYATFRALAAGVEITDRIVYAATDGVDTASAEVSVRLRGTNDAPYQLADIAALNFVEDGAAQTVDLATIFGDYDTGDSLSYQIALVPDAPVTASITGSILTFTPLADRFGAFSYTVSVTDSKGASITSTRYFGTIESQADAARAIGDSASTTKDSPVVIASLANDFWPDTTVYSVSAASLLGNSTATTDATTEWSVALTTSGRNALALADSVPNQFLGEVRLSRDGQLLEQSRGVLLGTPADDSSPYSTINTFGNLVNSVSNGYWLAMRIGATGNGDRNGPMSAGFFPFAEGWTGGHINSAGQLLSGVGVSQSNVVKVANGLFEVTVPEVTDALTDGYLFATAAQNDDNAVSVRPVPGTNRWQIRNNDNDDAANGFEDDGISFIYLPASTPGLIAGRWNSLAGSFHQVTGGVTATADVAGALSLTIPGQDPTKGTLLAIASGTVQATVNGILTDVPASQAVNFLDASGQFVLKSRATGAFDPLAADIQFVFLPFLNPLERLAPNPFSITSHQAVSDLGVTVTLQADGTFRYDPVTGGAAITGLLPGQSVTDRFTYQISDSLGRVSSAEVTVVVTGDRVVVSPAGGLVTTEAGGAATFSVVLAVAPTSDVTITPASSDSSEGSVSPAALVFTPANWNIAQTVTVTGVDDFLVDGTVGYSISLSSSSADTAFESLPIPPVSVVNTDNDAIGVSFSPASGWQTTERGGQAIIAVTLSSQPTAPVTIPFASSNLAEGTVNVSEMTFTVDNWNIAQSLVLTGVDDNLLDGNRTYTLVVGAITSSDAQYSGFNPADQTVTNVDLDFRLATKANTTHVGFGQAVGVEGRLDVLAGSLYMDGGKLTVEVVSGGASSDRLAIRNEGTGPGQVGVSGSDVTYNGVVVGSFTGGSGSTPLVVTFNSLANRLSIQQVSRAITFESVSASDIGLKTIRFTLVDGDNQSAIDGAKEKTIRTAFKRVIEFQEGVDRGFGEYSGARDVQIAQSNPNTTWATGQDASGLLVDFPDDGATNTSQVMLRFDEIVGSTLRQIPAGATITSASLFVQMNNTGDGGKMHRMLQSWSDSTSTWNSLVNGVQVDGVEAEVQFDSIWHTLDGSGASGLGYASVAVTPDVRAWVNGGKANYGWLFDPITTDGWQFSASETGNLELRPMLRVEWLPAGYSSASFQQGVNGYTGTSDTQIASNLTSQADTLNIGTDFPTTGSTEVVRQALLRFDQLSGNAAGQIPVNAQIHDAILTVGAVLSDAVGHGGTAHRMRIDWPETVTWGDLSSGVAIDGTEAASTASFQAGNSSLAPLAQAGMTVFEAIDDVQAWVRGTSNFGWVFNPWTNGTNGWFFASSEYDLSETIRPKLEVYYTELFNNAPTDIQLSSATVAENLVAGTAVGLLTSTDPDPGNTFTYSFANGEGDADNAKFSLVGNQLRTAESFDFETKSSYTIRVRSTDQGGQAYGAQSFEKVFVITVTDVNDAPVLTASSGSATTSGAAVVVDPGIGLSDVDSATIVGAVISISSGLVPAEDRLQFDNTAGITGVYDEATGILTLSGTDTVSAYQSALRSIRYRNLNSPPTAGIRTVSFRVNDGGAVDALSNIVSRPVDVVANASPILGVDTANVSGFEGTTITNTGTWSDPDTGDTVVLSASVGTVQRNANGTWQWSIEGLDDLGSTLVTITADDGKGGTASVQFNYSVTNRAPQLSSNSASVVGPVLSELTNTGTWSDVVADTVNLSASVGSVVKNANGTWSWSYTPNAAIANQTVTITGTDEDGGSSTVTFQITALVTITNSKVFYNGSGFESTGGVSGALDNGKQLLRATGSTQTTSFANVINYSRGINGIVLDVAGLAAGALVADDFTFRVSPNGASGVVDPSTWAAAPAPTVIDVAVTAGQPSRIRLEWADGAITNRWLQVIVKANGNTGLIERQVYYLGHALGEVNGVAPYRLTSADLSGVQGSISTAIVPITDMRDVNKDRRITSADMSFLQSRVSNSVLIGNITIPASGDGAEGEGGDDGLVGNGLGVMGLGTSLPGAPEEAKLSASPEIGMRWMPSPAWVSRVEMKPEATLADRFLSAWAEGESEVVESTQSEGWMESLVDYLSKRALSQKTSRRS